MKELERILTSENIEEEIRSNEDYIFSLIPELRSEVGFDQKHPHHSFDVWNHTIEALKHIEPDFELRLIVLLHDIGKPFAYIEGPIRHYYNVSGASTKMAYVILKRFGYEEAFINKILYLIKNCNGIIDDDVIERNPVLAEKLYEVQYCDIMAQDTKYLKDRVDYLTTTNYKLKKRRSRLYKKR